MNRSERRSRRDRRGGYTAVEMVIVLTIVGVLASIGIPRAGEAIRLARVDRAARLVAVDLEQAMTMAARQRTSVRIQQPVGTRRIVVSDVEDGTVFSTSDLESTLITGFGVEAMRMVPSTVDAYSTGQTSSALTVTLQAGDHVRTVTMSPAGQVRVN